jgi:hypothetical protein
MQVLIQIMPVQISELKLEKATYGACLDGGVNEINGANL